MKKKLFIGIAALCLIFLAPFLTAASTACAAEEVRQEKEYYIYNYGDEEIYYLLYIVAYYSTVDEFWSKQTFEDINCSNDAGYPLDLVSGQLFPYVYFGVKKSSDLYSAKVSCWCTDI